MFVLNVIKILFKNKRTEIKKFFHTRGWYEIVELLILIGITIVVVTVVMSVAYGTGYLFVDVLNWVDTTMTYGAVGLIFYTSLAIVGLIGYGIWHCIKWIWLNIKIAIAEAKEIK